MADVRFTGSGVALVTPFDDRGVNAEALRALVRFHHAGETAALIVCGSTGEAAAMSADEQRRAVEIVVDQNGGRLPVIVGCGGSGTREVAALAEAAAAAGADGILASAPPYNKPPQGGLLVHFRALLEASGLPMIVYNVPGRSAVNILPATIAELAAADERVVGVKEASGDISQVAELARLTAGRLALWSGNDDQVLPLMALGGQGVISVLANVAPRDTHRMVAAFLAGRLDAALEVQLRYLPAIAALFAESNPIPVKTAVGWLGFEVGELRAPLVPLSRPGAERLRRALEEAGVEFPR